MCVIVVLAAFVGCAKENSVDTPFVIYNNSENMQVKIGDNRNDVSKLMGIDEQYIILFEEDNIERVTYWEHEDVQIDYDVATNIVVGLRFSNPQWSIFNGLKVGDSADMVKNQYQDGSVHDSNGRYLYVAYDESGSIIKYNEDVPYHVTFAISDGMIEEILVRNNAAYPKY